MCSSTVRLKSELCAKRCRAWDVRAWQASQVEQGTRASRAASMFDCWTWKGCWTYLGNATGVCKAPALHPACLDALHHGLVQRLASGAIPGAATQDWVLQSLFSAGTLQPVCAGGGVGKGVW